MQKKNNKKTDRTKYKYEKMYNYFKLHIQFIYDMDYLLLIGLIGYGYELCFQN